MRANKKAELAAWLHRQETAETRVERDLAGIRVMALRAGLRLQTAAEMIKNEKSPDQEASDLGRESNRKRSNKQDK